MPRTVETYEQAIEFLFGRINYERLHSSDYSTSDFRLDRMQQLLSLLGNPQNRLTTVHIAGTKGKGSTAVMIAEILSAADYHVGLYTSPHIQVFEERIRVGGVPLRPEQLVELVNSIRDAVAVMDRAPGKNSPTYFEIATALAWLHFQREQVDFVVMEVGLGGRLDSTNICVPAVSVITSISRDHTKLLGSEIASITREKAGIVKPGVSVVSGVMDEEARSTLEAICRKRDAPLVQLDRDIHYKYRGPAGTYDCGTGDAVARVDVRAFGRDWSGVPLPMVGEHQARNAAVVLGVIHVLASQGYEIADNAIEAGMRQVRCPLRIEVLSRQPLVIADAAHNWASISELLNTLDGEFIARRRVLVFGTTKDKDVSGLLRQLLPRFETVILTQYLSNPRAVPYQQLQRQVQAISGAATHLAADPATAWKLAKRFAHAEDMICITGSFFVAAEMRDIIIDETREVDSAAATSRPTV